jgi:RNA polymerase sigma factor (sigma-70 family)
LNEATAIIELQNGNTNAIDVLIEMYQLKIYNAILNFVQNENDAEELTQDVFIKTINNISSFKGDAAIGTWLYKVAINEAFGFLRKKKAKKRLNVFVNFFQGANETEVSNFEHPGTAIEQKEETKAMFAAIKKLPERQMTAFTLRYIEQLSYKEIATIMDANESTIESLLHRAKQQLKQTIKK